NNFASTGGGGLDVIGSASLTVTNTTFANNTVSGPGSVAGGGALIESAGGSTWSGVVFQNNSVTATSGTAQGGGIAVRPMLWEPDVVRGISQSTFTNNTAVSLGGGQGSGGAIYNTTGNLALGGTN